MDGNSITIEVLINKVSFKLTLININYKYYSIVEKNSITKLRLPRVKIPPKPIINFVKKKTKEPGVKITEIAKFSIDISGYKWNIYTYIVLVLLNPVIIRLLWIRKDNVIIRPVINTLIINSYNLRILTRETLILFEIKELITAPFATLIKGAKKCQKPLTVFKISLKDIIKVLRLKIIKILTEIRKLLPA